MSGFGFPWECLAAILHYSYDSVLWRHCKKKHEGKIVNFKCDVRSVYCQDATLRQIAEAVDIRREGASINNKTEWNNTNLPRLAVE